MMENIDKQTENEEKNVQTNFCVFKEKRNEKKNPKKFSFQHSECQFSGKLNNIHQFVSKEQKNGHINK